MSRTKKIRGQPRPQGLLLDDNRLGEGPGDEVGSVVIEVLEANMCSIFRPHLGD